MLAAAAACAASGGAEDDLLDACLQGGEANHEIDAILAGWDAVVPEIYCEGGDTVDSQLRGAWKVIYNPGTPTRRVIHTGTYEWGMLSGQGTVVGQSFWEEGVYERNQLRKGKVFYMGLVSGSTAPSAPFPHGTLVESGNFREGLLHGRGMASCDGVTRKGTFVCGILRKGRRTFDGLCVEDGEFDEQGQQLVRGTVRNAAMLRQGDFQNGKLHGMGVKTFLGEGGAEKVVEEGNFVQDLLHGHGRITYHTSEGPKALSGHFCQGRFEFDGEASLQHGDVLFACMCVE